MKYLDKMNERLRAFSKKTGIVGKDLALIDQADLEFICNPTMKMTTPVVLAGPPLKIDRAGRTSVLTIPRSQEFSDGDRQVMKSMDLSEEDYRKHGAPESGNEKRDLKLPEAKKANFKDRLDSALGLTESDYAAYG